MLNKQNLLQLSDLCVTGSVLHSRLPTIDHQVHQARCSAEDVQLSTHNDRSIWTSRCSAIRSVYLLHLNTELASTAR